MVLDIMADMVNTDCAVHIRWLDALCPVLVFLVHTCS